MSRPDVTPARADLERLARILGAQIDGHRRLLDLVRTKREAIRTADVDAVTRCCGDEQAIIRRLQDVERERRALFQRCTAPGADPPGLADLASAADEALGTVITTRAHALREVGDAVRRESTIVAAAAQALSQHMSGIMQTIHRALSRVGMYERRGRITVNASLDCCIDLKT